MRIPDEIRPPINDKLIKLIGINDDAWARHLNPLMLTEAN